MSLISQPRDDGICSVEQRCQRANDAALGLPAQSEQNKIMPRENSVDDLRHDRVVIADDAREKLLARAQFSIRLARISSLTESGCDSRCF